MASETRWIEDGDMAYACNLTTSKTGAIRSVAVLVGPDHSPGWRAKDGPQARQRRRKAKRAVMAALGLPARKVVVVARYSCLRVAADGMIERLDDLGRVIGAYEP